MKPVETSKQAGRNRKGLALVTVISVLMLATILLLALFSTTQTELQSTVAYSDGVMARTHADSAVNIVINQIQTASQQDDKTPGVEIWASQPGMVRQYRENGALLRGSKLYSDSRMIAATEKEIIDDIPAANWQDQPERYVDMNEPAVRPGEVPGKKRIIFPIIDPRAFSSDPLRTVEGFSYTNYANGTSGAALKGVVLPGGGSNEDSQRLPMPVEWLYVLKDGTLGFLDDGNTFVGASGQKATERNPIVARIAFWTDDESAKININTAGEGTKWDTPRLFHERDGEWARFQPMMYEYQRYPGHPAAVCMSSVLFPKQDMNPPMSDKSAFDKSVELKERIYQLMPKILPGGSKSGSVLVPPGRAFSPTDFKYVQEALSERLFASVDEFLLEPRVDGSGERPEIDLGESGFWSGMKRADVLERIRFFLTPRSRAPETNPFGLPKISMWPIPRRKGEYRTVYDNTIAYCSTLGGKEYFFTREDARSQTELTAIQRNNALFQYLMRMTDVPIPGFGTSSSATFANKYGDNRQQILVEMFDYIRSTNLYDDNIAEKTVGNKPAIPGLPGSRVSAYAATGGMASKTFTPARNDTGSSYPGHGEVIPTVLPKAKDEVYRGMGRFVTISEAGLHFIACAVGTDRAGGQFAPRMTPLTTPPAAANYVPPDWKGGFYGNYNNWYSNFPPLSKQVAENKTFYLDRYPTTHELEGHAGNKDTHPGYKPSNWNWTLDKDKPLPNGTTRTQASFLLEWFSPSAGWTLINPDFAIEIDASDLSIGGKPMFPYKGGKIIVRPYAHMSSAHGVYQRGGTFSYRAFLQGRGLLGVNPANGFSKGSLLNDARWDDFSNKASPIEKDCIQYNLVSDFFDVPTDGHIPFDGGRVIVKIFKNEATTLKSPLQIINFNFPAAQFPTPKLVVRSQNTESGQHWNGTWWVRHPTAPPYWWSFHWDGAIGRNADGTRVATSGDKWDHTSGMGGRFRFIGDEIILPTNQTADNEKMYRGNLVSLSDTLHSLVLRHGDPRLTMGQYIVPETEFEPHRYYGQSERMAHNIVLLNWSQGVGLDKGEDKKGWRLVKDANYHANFLPDHPYSPATGAGLQRYGDFDRATANQTDGAYINKPDEGNSYSIISSSTGEQGVPYFSDPWVSYMGGSTYFSPNRQVSSPGMFGSLPTGVHNAGSSPAGKRREPWRTLFFRPQLWSKELGLQPHIGAPKTLKGYGGTSGLPNQGVDPPDHLFMDFFWMPVVEPYAISEPGSTAGKLNINYQIAPFRHITRSTGLHAAFKSEVLTAIAHADANVYLTRPGGAPSNKAQTWFWDETSNATKGKKFWHRQIDADATLKIFQERFNSGFAFISPAQICEMYLLPKKTSSLDTRVPDAWPEKISGLLKSNGGAPAPDSILKFWEQHAITAENLKERPYTNLYPRLTTRSNTYQVHVRAQTIRKARSVGPEVFDASLDSVTSEYRGSVVLERYIDLTDPRLKSLDFATGAPGTKTLDTYHRIRVLNQKRFDP